MTASVQLEKTSLRPGEILRGTARWSGPATPDSAEARLIWFTRGKGTCDSAIVATETFAHPTPEEPHAFQFTLPDFPFSFSGKLVSVVWAVELVLDPDASAIAEFILAPEGREITLPTITDDAPRWGGVRFVRRR